MDNTGSGGDAWLFMGHKIKWNNHDDVRQRRDISFMKQTGTIHLCQPESVNFVPNSGAMTVCWARRRCWTASAFLLPVRQLTMARKSKAHAMNCDLLINFLIYIYLFYPLSGYWRLVWSGCLKKVVSMWPSTISGLCCLVPRGPAAKEAVKLNFPLLVLSCSLLERSGDSSSCLYLLNSVPSVSGVWWRMFQLWRPGLVPTEALLAPVDHQSAPRHHAEALVDCPVGFHSSGDQAQGTNSKG